MSVIEAGRVNSKLHSKQAALKVIFPKRPTSKYFEVAGANKVFRPAKAIVNNGNILVSSPDVKEPVAVRYAFKDFVIGDLFSTEGFPVSSFRTDDW